MDDAVGSECTAEIWSRHSDCICCCDIKSAACRCILVTYLQPTLERRWQFWKRACLFHISWAVHQSFSNHDNLYRYRPALIQSKFLAHDCFWVNSFDGVFMPSLLSSVFNSVELQRPNISLANTYDRGGSWSLTAGSFDKEIQYSPLSSSLFLRDSLAKAFVNVQLKLKYVYISHCYTVLSKILASMLARFPASGLWLLPMCLRIQRQRWRRKPGL